LKKRAVKLKTCSSCWSFAAVNARSDNKMDYTESLRLGR
jgi:hypothetical protein